MNKPTPPFYQKHSTKLDLDHSDEYDPDVSGLLSDYETLPSTTSINEFRKSGQNDSLLRENTTYKEALEEKKAQLLSSSNEIIALKKEVFRLSLKIQNLESECQSNSSSISDGTNWSAIVAEGNRKYSELLNRFHLLQDETGSLNEDICRLTHLQRENAALRDQVEVLEAKNKEHAKTVFDLNVRLRRTPSQGNLQFHEELEKIKNVIISAKVPSVEVKKELEILKTECSGLREFMTKKDTAIDELQTLNEQKDLRISELESELEAKSRAVKRLTITAMELKSRELELEEACLLEKLQNNENTWDIKVLRHHPDNPN